MSSPENNQSELILHSEIEKWWGLPEEQNISDYILRKIKDHLANGRSTCIENPTTGESLTYQVIPELSKKIASKLFKLGLREGDTVIYSTHDPIKLYVFMLGVWRANGIVRSSYPEDFGDSLIQRIKESKATFLACDKHCVQEYLKASKSINEWAVKLIVFGEEIENDENYIPISKFYNDDGSSMPSQCRTLDDIALILPTSGTTGDSKGAIYTNRILLENIIFHEMMPYTDMDKEPTIITSRPTHYVGSITAWSLLTKGRHLLMMSPVTVKGLLEAIDKYKVRAILAFPAYLTGMLNHEDRKHYNLDSLQYLTTAGQVVVPEAMAVIKTLPNLKHFINLYGMTESGLLTSSADWLALQGGACKALPCKDYSVGKLPPGSSLKVLDIDSGNIVGAGMKGELCFKGLLTTAGYLHRPEEEAQTYVGNGWIKTGDIGLYDTEGYIYIVDRAKEIFKWNNNHISPSEIENVLLRHPSIEQAAVIGVPSPEGSIPRGFVVLKPEVKPAVSDTDLLRFAENNLPPYKQLKGGLFIIPELPLGKTGKVVRKMLSEIQVQSF